MKRTTIVLPDDLAALLERERRRRGVSTAAIVREALDAYLAPPTRPLPFVALGRSGYQTTGRDVEEILAREWTEDLIKGHGAPGEGSSDGPTATVAQPEQPAGSSDQRAAREVSAAGDDTDRADHPGDGQARRSPAGADPVGHPDPPASVAG